MDDMKIKIFLAAVRTGSFSKAAREMNCTQSAVTQNMNQLENELGCKLLLRNHSGIRLTPEGEALLPAIIRIDTALSDLFFQAKKITSGKSAPIRIGSFSSIANEWLPEIMKHYQSLHPEITFEIRIGTDSVRDMLLNREVDLALGDSERLNAFRWYPLKTDEYYAILPKGMYRDRDSITQDELMNHTFLLAPLDAFGLRLEHMPANQITVNSDEDNALLAMVAQGLGVAAMPRLCLSKIPEEVDILPLLPPTHRILGAALPNSPTQAAREFVDFLTAHYRA